MISSVTEKGHDPFDNTEDAVRDFIEIGQGEPYHEYL